MKNIKSIIALVLVFLMVITLFSGFILTGFSAKASSVDSMQSELDRLAEKKEKLEKELSAISEKKEKDNKQIKTGLKSSVFIFWLLKILFYVLLSEGR